MDKLIFTNSIGQSIEFSPTSQYKWIKATDLGGAEVDIVSVSSPYQDGSTMAGDAYFKSKSIRLDFVIASSNVAEDLRELNNRLNPKLGIGTLTYHKNGTDYTLNKVVVRSLPSLPDGKDKSINLQLSSVILQVLDPLYTDAQETEEQVTSSANLLEFPVNISDAYEFDIYFADGVPIVNIGDVDCPVTVVVDGAITSPLEIINATTSEKIVIVMSLLENEKLTITTDIDNINVIKTDKNTGNTTSAFQYIDADQTTFFKLATGENLIKVVANQSEVESATIKYKNRYVGV